MLTASVAQFVGLLIACSFGVDFGELAVLANDNASLVFACLTMNSGVAEVRHKGFQHSLRFLSCNLFCVSASQQMCVDVERNGTDV